VETKFLPRPQVIQKLWLYIREKKLQVSPGLSKGKFSSII
jgi:hypothetical protein